MQVRKGHFPKELPEEQGDSQVLLHPLGITAGLLSSFPAREEHKGPGAGPGKRLWSYL